MKVISKFIEIKQLPSAGSNPTCKLFKKIQA